MKWSECEVAQPYPSTPVILLYSIFILEDKKEDCEIHSKVR